MKVLDVQEVEGWFDVYDIDVDADHSFIVEGCVLHNSQLCQSLDGTEWPLDSGPRPPAHVGCRSSTVPVLDERFAFLREGATRSARDDDGVGKVGAKTTYFEWLKTQPSSFIDSAIGPKRAQLLRDGGLSAERFAELQLGRQFEPLSLNSMKLLEPVAFARAGL